MSKIQIKNLNKIYDNGFHAVKDVNIDIQDKEFIVLVGPSGCGKSTTLRMIAGLEEVSSGEIIIEEENVTNMEPKDRDIAMVFQNYALYPHMTVYENMTFALKLRKVDKTEINKKVNEVAKILGIEDLLKRKPAQLSGGQRQRVALGRAMVRSPKVFLMDEPLSNLDAKLRVQTRSEIIKLHKLLNNTFIYVTHDQTEAMTMGTRIVVMNNGVIKQIDTPQNIYENPQNMFVAGFIGSPQMNFIHCNLKNEQDSIIIENKELNIKLSKKEDKQLQDFREFILGIRPENVTLEEQENCTGIKGKIEVIEYLGAEAIIYLSTSQGEIVLKINDINSLKIGDELKVYFKPNKVYIFNKETEDRII
ncbi:sugar ABC transporter ATP-binding protein [Clostridiaceae bacterium 14S0207]|nr:sugar ABC transporter ATP-binding protein [Clostridiaceae bacterium 14S0207]